MKKINDSVFGEMTYDHSWCKEIESCVFDRNIELRVVAEAYKGQEILECQREAFKKYSSDYAKLIVQIPSALLEYYLDNYDSIASTLNIPDRINKDNINKELITKLIKVRTVYFDRKGNYGWLCDCAWDTEHGICVLLSGERVKVVEHDYLL